jgi:hypothetical protein
VTPGAANQQGHQHLEQQSTPHRHPQAAACHLPLIGITSMPEISTLEISTQEISPLMISMLKTSVPKKRSQR